MSDIEFAERMRTAPDIDAQREAIAQYFGFRRYGSDGIPAWTGLGGFIALAMIVVGIVVLVVSNI
jgi:hypothetical protein